MRIKFLKVTKKAFLQQTAKKLYTRHDPTLQLFIYVC